MKVYFKANFCHVKALKEDYIWIFDDFQGKNKAKRWKNTHRLELSTAPTIFDLILAEFCP